MVACGVDLGGVENLGTLVVEVGTDCFSFSVMMCLEAEAEAAGTLVGT